MTTTSAQLAASAKSVVARSVSDSSTVDLVAEVARVAVVLVDVGGGVL
jgi:hypothetical protein